MSLTKLSLGGNNLFMTSLFPARESLVSDIPAGDGNIEKLFLRCIVGNNKKSCKILKIEEQLMPLNHTYDKTKPDCDWCRKSSIQTRSIGRSSGQSQSSPPCQKKRRYQNIVYFQINIAKFVILNLAYSEVSKIFL
jgi:hypothetical protein